MCPAVGADGLRAALGQPRLLIPVLLALTYNRWNLLYAEQYNVHLELIAMLLGFFTYKMAVLGRQGVQLMNDLSSRSNDSQDSTTAGSAAGGQDAGNSTEGSAMTLDRIFVKRILSE